MVDPDAIGRNSYRLGSGVYITCVCACVRACVCGRCGRCVRVRACVCVREMSIGR